MAVISETEAPLNEATVGPSEILCSTLLVDMDEKAHIEKKRKMELEILNLEIKTRNLISK